MEKSIQLTGIARAVPQTDAPDGSCQEIINLRHRKGAWRPVGAKTTIGSSDFGIEFAGIYLHDIEGGINAGYPNWIGYLDGSLYLIDRAIPITPVAILIASGLDTSIPVKVTFLKRFMLVTTGAGIKMFLWGDGVYSLVETLPVPNVTLHRQNIFLVDKVTMGASETAGEVLGNFYTVLNNQSSSDGRLYGSIMYMAAYKLFDGSYILHSIPKYLELSNDGVIVIGNYTGTKNYKTHFKFTVAGMSASIDTALYPSSLIGVKDLIESVCIFATRATPQKQIDESTLTDVMLTSPTRGYPPAPSGNGSVSRQYYFADYFPLNSDFTKLAESAGWYKVHEFIFDTLVGATGVTFTDVDTKNYYQNYATSATLDADQFSHHALVPKVVTTYNDRLHIGSIKTLYGAPYVQWNEWIEGWGVSGYTTGNVCVWLKTSLGNAVVNSPIQIPHFFYVNNIVEKKTSIEVAQARITYLNSNPVTSMVPGSAYLRIETVTPDFLSVSLPIDIFTTVANVQSWNVCYKVIVSSEYKWMIPMMGYNDSRAYRMQITYHNGLQDMVIADNTLKKNEGINFSYWVNPTFTASNLTPVANYQEIEKYQSEITSYTALDPNKETPYDANRVQVSEIQNPLIYPAANSYQIGTGEIIALASGSEPLSVGQFGQFPLQVFTTKGIWTMQIGLGSVLYTNILPVNGEVADNVNNILSMMGGVLYSTLRGLFILHGAQVSQISEIIEGKPKDFGSDEITTLLTDARFTPSLVDSISDINFLDYLLGSSVGFDQIQKELIVTNKDKGYSYVFSFESKYWTKVSGSYKLLINAWPHLYALTDTDIYNLSLESDHTIDTMIITNALRLDHPQVMKKIERLILRCDLTSSSQAGIYLFGSDDLNAWQLLTGQQKTGTHLKDLMIIRSHGSAKYYLLVINGNITTDSEIKNIDLKYVAKWIDKIR